MVSANTDSSNPRRHLRDQLLGANQSGGLAGPGVSFGLKFESGVLDIVMLADTMRIFVFLCA